MSSLMKVLQDKDHKKAYALSKEICAKSAVSNEYYIFFDEFIGFLSNKSAYIRSRGFILACAQARWDEDGKLFGAMHSMLKLLHDEKPTVVRQCLGALHEVIVYRPELSDLIQAEIQTIDLSQYKDTMSPLIKKDIEELLKVVE